MVAKTRKKNPFVLDSCRFVDHPENDKTWGLRATPTQRCRAPYYGADECLEKSPAPGPPDGGTRSVAQMVADAMHLSIATKNGIGLPNTA